MSGTADEIVSKGRFAQIIGVSPGRVSQYIAEKKIGPEALDGQGRSAKIRLQTAQRHLRERLDVNQRFGLNGLSTKLGEQPGIGAPQAGNATEASSDASSDDAGGNGGAELLTQPTTVEKRIQEQKLRQAEIRTEEMERERRAAQGLYTRTSDAKAGIERVAAAMIKVFEAGLVDLANSVAAKFSVPQRDAIHLLRNEFRSIRAKAAKSAAAEGETMPQLLDEQSAAEEDRARAA